MIEWGPGGGGFALLLESARWPCWFRVIQDTVLFNGDPFVQSSATGLNPSPFGLVGLPLRDFLPSAMPAMRSLLSVRPINLRRYRVSVVSIGRGARYEALIAQEIFLEIHDRVRAWRILSNKDVHTHFCPSDYQ